MIKYTKGIFGLNLLLRVHGSAIYRALLPAIIASCLWYVIDAVFGPPQSELLHPYAAGVLIGGITFLLVFRVTQSYGRYWEATTSVYKMQSKWMDATVHISNYHMQSSQYNKIKPPSFAEYHYLNAYRLTRDRERIRSSRMSLGTSGRISMKRAQKKSIESVSVDGGISGIVGMTPSIEESMSTEFTVLDNMVQSVSETLPKRVLVSRISSRRFESAFKNGDLSEDSDDDEEDIGITVGDRAPQFLTGRPRTDGGWSKLFDDRKSTYLSPHNLKEIDVNGFASIQGGRTPVLFLQELAHLSSLMNAVALSTLRNDVEGVSSPLSLYVPGSAWPAVDPKLDENLYDSKLEAWLYAFLYFLGKGRSPSERAKYNIARPIPVLGGVSDAEIQMLQMARGPLAKTQLCFGWMSEFATREHGEAHGALLSRTMQFMSDGMVAYNDCRKIMFNPFPFPFAQITSTFVNFMWFVVPFLMHQYIRSRWLGVIMTLVSVMCLQSIDEVAKELENPFRNIPNELPVVTYQAEYNEALLTMYSGFHPDSFWKPPRELREAHLRKSNPNDEMAPIKEAHSGENGTVYSQSDKSLLSKDGAEEQEQINAQLRSIVEQQGRIMEEMMKEQKRLNRTLEKILLQTVGEDS